MADAIVGPSRENKQELTPTAAPSSPPVDAGRVGTYAAIGAVTRLLPLPWVPDVLSRRLRGAIAQDITERHSLTLSPEAREIVAEPGKAEKPRGAGSQTYLFLRNTFLKRFGPLAMVPPLEGALDAYIFAHLLSRYYEVWRRQPSDRVEADEARRVRRAIDRAILHVLSVESPPFITPRPFANDERDPATQVIDRILITAAGLPAWIIHRLDAAFDDTLPSTQA